MRNLNEMVEVVWLGRVEYRPAWELQNALAAEIAAGIRLPVLLLLEHPHVYTIGRRGGWANLLWDERERLQRGVEVVEVDRGGDVTYHGPGQLVGYPLLRLADDGWHDERLPKADFVGYVRKLENSLIRTLTHYGIPAVQQEGFTGVWVHEKRMAGTSSADPGVGKIASIGVKVDSRGISRHGFALNVQPQMEFWKGIIPCGLNGVHMVSIADYLRPVPEMSDVIQQVAKDFSKTFSTDIIWKNQIEESNP